MRDPVPIPFPVPLAEAVNALCTATARTNAVRFQLSPACVARWRVRLGIPAYRHHAAYGEVLAILQAHPEGLSGAAIARQRGVSRQAVHLVLSGLRAEGKVCKHGAKSNARWVLVPPRGDATRHRA